MLGLEVNTKSRNPFRHTINSLHAGICPLAKFAKKRFCINNHSLTAEYLRIAGPSTYCTLLHGSSTLHKHCDSSDRIADWG